MYVCICNALCDRTIREALDTGVERAGDVHARLGCETQCGRCLPTIADMLDGYRNGGRAEAAE